MGIERWAGIAAGLTAGVAVLYYLYGPRIEWPAGDDEPAAVEAPAPPAAPPEPQATEAPVAPEPQQPAEPRQATPAAAAPGTPPASAPMPAGDLAASDADLRAAAAEVFGVAPVESFLVPDRVIQNFVATIDSLDRDPVPLRFRVVQEVPEVPVVEKDGDRLVLSSDNDERYRLLADTLRATSAQSMARLYQRYYPLLERAWREMGYPDARFNDRVLQVIDHLLAAPDVEHPIELVRPKVLYLYADPELEALSSGQKLMVRIGPANRTIAKTRLRELRALLAGGGKAAKAPAR